MARTEANPKRRKRQDYVGITVYVAHDVKEIWDAGGINKWDTQEIGRKALSKAVLARKETWTRPAYEVGK